ncbi:MAG: hypothetical protein ACE5IJ_06855 [Thermoplasmata archaeon]
MRPIWGGTIEREFFTTSDIIKKFEGIGRHVPTEIKGYMVGGGAMSLRGDKEVTKDVDLVFANEDEATVFYRALRRESFSSQNELEDAYVDIKAFAIMRDPSMFWVDIFVERVAGWFYLSDSVKSRAEVWGSFGKFTLLLCSREDIFLSKSVTERDRDLEDMATLYRRGVDSEIIMNECNVQTINSGNIWHLYLETKLGEMEKVNDFSVPWRSELYEAGCRILLEKEIPDLLAKGPATVQLIIDAYGADEKTTREVLSRLEEEGKVEVDRRKRPYEYSLPRVQVH